MISSVNGFKLEVSIDDGLPHVRVSFPTGEVIIDTDRVSVTGLRKLPEVLERAADLAYRELDRYYHQLRVRND